MAVGTHEQYKERLLKVRPNIYLNRRRVGRFNGKKSEGRDLTDWTKGGTYVMKWCYDVADSPEYEDVCVTTSHIDGEGISRYTYIHHNMDDLLKEQLMTHLICQHVGGCMQHYMRAGAMNALYSVMYDCDGVCGIEYHKRLLAYTEYCQKCDLVCNCTQTDAKGSHDPKYKCAHVQPDPDPSIHVVGTNVDGTGMDGKPCKGIIVQGAKICSSRAPYVDGTTVNPTKFTNQDDSNYAAAFALPADWDGVKLMALPGLHHKHVHLDASYAQIGGAESLTIFGDCFVPYDRVFMCGRSHKGITRYAGYLAPIFAHYHRHSHTGYKTAVSEVIASQAALVVDMNDITRGSHAREKICDIIQTTELVSAVGEAVTHHVMGFPSGQWVPDEVLTSAGRRLAGHNMYHEYETLADLTDRVCISLPTEESFFTPGTAELCNKYTRCNPAYSVRDTHQVIRVMEDKLCDSREAARAVTGVHGGDSPLMEAIILMSRYGLEELRKITKYLVGIPGYEKCPRYEYNIRTATPRTILARFDAISSKKENK